MPTIKNISKKISEAAASLKSSLNSRNLRSDDALAAISELNRLRNRASDAESLNQLKRISQAVKESTRGLINVIDAHGEFGLVSYFISNFPIDEQYIDEILEGILISNKLSESEKIKLHNQMIDMLVKHEVFCMQDSLGGVSYTDAKRVLQTSLRLPGGGDFDVNKTPIGRLCQNYLNLRNDAAAMIIGVLSMSPSSVSSESNYGFGELQLWVAQNEMLMIGSIIDGDSSEFNTPGIVKLAEELGTPRLACALNIRSDEPDLKTMIRGIDNYDIIPDTKLYDQFASYGITKEVPEKLLETMIAYSILVKNILPDSIRTGRGYSIISALAGAGRVIDSLDDLLTHPDSKVGNTKPGAQAVVDYLMERVTGNENFSVLDKSWLKPYAQKNLNYMKHAFSNDLGI